MPIEQTQIRVGQNLVLEDLRKVLVTDDLTLGLINIVIHDLKVNIQDDAEEPESTDNQIEQFHIFLRAHIDDASICPHDPHRMDRTPYRASQVIHAVRVDRD